MNKIEVIKRQVKMIDIVRSLGIEPNTSGFIRSINNPNEKTPSLKLYFDTDSYFDFSSSSGGDVIDFYKNYFNIDIHQAINELYEKYCHQERSITHPVKNFRKEKIELFEFEKDFFEERAGIFEFDANLAREEAERFALQDLLYRRKEIQVNIFESLFTNSTLSDQAYNYLISDKRKLTDDTIRKFKLFSISDTEVEFLRDTFSSEELVLSGLYSLSGYFILSDQKQVIIPYVELGKIVYLRGRYLNGTNHNPPKSINKYMGLGNFAKNLTSKRFFNVDTLKQSNDKKLIITESEFDAMIAEQFGARSIAIPGVSNFPKDKIGLLDHFEIYLTFDNDKAGANALNKVADLFHRKIYAIKIKNGKDLTEAL